LPAYKNRTRVVSVQMGGTVAIVLSSRENARRASKATSARGRHADAHDMRRERRFRTDFCVNLPE
jgi:hypothetical protein